MHPTEPKLIGRYQVLRSLSKGGMGEVFLAFDPICKREVALKLIREDLKNHAIIKERFLREAHVAAQLVHPSIIPIFSIDSTEEKIFYTMPYVEGQTLKEILKATYEEQKEGEIKHPIGSSILALTRIFLAVCEAIAYTHSRKILHRDLKPDNIIVGKYGEVLILDWGLADFIGRGETLPEEDSFDEEYKDLTRPGKVPGTLNYIAPERARGDPSDVTMDIYSLGVILYQLLTLRIPFPRSTLKSFRKTMHLERLVDPLELAPYREIPQHLGDIAKRCLCFSPSERFQNVDEMIVELKNFLEGKPEWIPTALLKIDVQEDWEFQENILLTKHLAITRSPDVMEWVCLMISRACFTGNIKIETQIQLGKDAQGLGLLLAVERGIQEGYCVWLGEEMSLFYNNVEVMTMPEVPLKKGQSYRIALEKEENRLSLFIDDALVCRYLSHTPSSGTRLGILCRDADFELGPLKVSVGSQNATVNCLAVPDAFLANKDYSKALIEYRRIANSFSGRTEGREALFRAGITLLEEAIARKKSKERDMRYLMALEEFGKLRFTPGAPLEYLGKSLVYKATREIEEEIKCLELSLRKYPKHPLISIIREHIIFRLHESASRDRIAAFHFALLSLRYLPGTLLKSDNSLLIGSLKRHLEPVPFLLPFSPEEQFLSCQLAFWLFKPITLIEMIETSTLPPLSQNAAYALLALGFHEWVKENLHLLENPQEIEIVLKRPKTALAAYSSKPCGSRALFFLLDQALLHGKSKEVLPYFAQLPSSPEIDALHIFALLLQSKWKRAQELLEKYPEEVLTDDSTPFYVLMGCLLRRTEGKEIALSHFSGSIDLPHPPTSVLLSYFLRGKISEKKGWIAQAFPWEKIQLFRHLQLYYHCAGNKIKSAYYFRKIKKELSNVRTQNSYP